MCRTIGANVAIMAAGALGEDGLGHELGFVGDGRGLGLGGLRGVDAERVATPISASVCLAIAGILSRPNGVADADRLGGQFLVAQTQACVLADFKRGFVDGIGAHLFLLRS